MMQMRTMCGTILAAAMTMVGSAMATANNLVYNSGFEEVAGGAPVGYVPPPHANEVNDSYAPSFAASTNDVHSGKYCLEYIAHNSAGFAASRGISMKPGKYYRFSAWIRTDCDPVMGASVQSVTRSHPPGVVLRMYPRLPSGWKGAWPRVGYPVLCAGGGESSWRKYTAYLKAHDRFNEVWLAFYVTNVEGGGWFDDLELVEVSAEEALPNVQTNGFRLVTAENIKVHYSDGENLVFNGSFELASNPDMPDFIKSPIGVAWFTPDWNSRRVADESSPDGGHYFHLADGFGYHSSNLILDSERHFTLSFSVRGRLGGKIDASFSGAQGKHVLFDLTPEWTRHSVSFDAISECDANKKFNVFVRPKNKVEYDLDAVSFVYGDCATYKAHRDEADFVALAERFSRPIVAPPAPAEGLDDTPIIPSGLDWRYDVAFVGEGNVFRGAGVGEVVITNSSGNVVLRQAVAPRQIRSGIALGEDLPCGRYGVIGKEGSFMVLPRKSRYCRVDRFAHMAETEAGPYLPCATGIARAACFKSRIKELVDLGFNTVYGWSFGTSGKDGRDPVLTADFLENCRTNGMAVIMTSPVDLTTPAGRSKSFSEIFSEVKAWQHQWSDNPAIRMWANYDEVYLWWGIGPNPKNESDMQTTKDWFMEVDPYRLTWNNSTVSGRIYGGNKSTDVTSATVYTLRDNLSGAPTTIRAARTLVDAGRRSGNNPAITGIWLQFYSGEGEAGSFSREPSVGEMRLMLYGCLTQGVRAFWLFSMRPRSTTLYEGTGALFRELDALKEELAYGEYLAFESTSAKVIGMTIRHKGKLLVVTVNNSYSTVTASLRLPVGYKRGKATLRFDGETCDYDDYSIRTTWKPCERKIFELNK